MTHLILTWLDEIKENEEDEEETPTGRGIQGVVLIGGKLRSITANGTRGHVVVTWFRSFFAACGWAALIAAGSLVYTHFTRKWSEHGYPAIPIAALAAVAEQKATQTPAAAYSRPPMYTGYRTTHTTSAPKQQASFLDEYEG